ncbi:hypothetical protein GCM10022197_30910 [Microlunatus spumicola]|uniref:PknH-like extracellular domain-containing protein n=1 Tax=Microlunatus spumicola TaxID=81499 RepID=A0ABP6XUM9_9ACTN
MADDRSKPRPRRAFGAGDPTTGSPDPEAPTTPDAGATGPAEDAGTTSPGGTPTAGTAGAAGTGTDADGRTGDDEPRPIFREAAPDADAATVRTPSDDEPDEAGPTRAGRLNFTPRPRPVEDDATTLLPRTTGRGDDRTGRPVSALDDDELDDRPRRLGSRARLALLVGAVAAVVVVGLAIGYAVVGVRDQPAAGSDPGQTATGATAAPGSPAPTALLEDTSMLAPEGARSISSKRTWTAGTTVRGPVPDGSGPACLGSDPLEGAPTAQQTITRTLAASGDGGPTALHVAQAYASVEDATQAFTVTARALGTCAVPGDWLFTGRSVEGVGDASTAVAVKSTDGDARTQHWVVMSRTGRALDVVDAATPGKTALNVNDVTKALSSVVATQCTAAGGTCPTTVSTKDSPPPAGGDEPGFLATGDLPPVGSNTAPWVGTPVEAPSEDFSGSQCESVNWSTTAATDKSSRVYLLQDVPGIFGLNEIVLTARDAASATKLVDKVRSDWSSCKERKLTATVDSPTKVTGVASADGTPVTGWTTEVEQKAGSTTTRFRVGIAASGDKVAFVFLNPQKGLDVDGDDWNTVAVRAVQRATQQS